MHSQPTLKKNKRVQTYVNQEGDTMIQMKLSDARIILNRVLQADVSDSLVKYYERLDTLKSNTISLQVDKIKLLQNESSNKDTLVANLYRMMNNDKEEIKLLNSNISNKNKELKKSNLFLTLAVVGDIVLPIGAGLAITQLKK